MRAMLQLTTMTQEAQTLFPLIVWRHSKEGKRFVITFWRPYAYSVPSGLGPEIEVLPFICSFWLLSCKRYDLPPFHFVARQDASSISFSPSWSQQTFFLRGRSIHFFCGADDLLLHSRSLPFRGGRNVSNFIVLFWTFFSSFQSGQPIFMSRLQDFGVRSGELFVCKLIASTYRGQLGAIRTQIITKPATSSSILNYVCLVVFNIDQPVGG